MTVSISTLGTQDVKMEINKAYLPFIESPVRYVRLRGGGGSGKSVATAQKKMLRVLASKERHRILCVRKVATTIRNSQLRLFRDLISDYKLQKFFTVRESDLSVICRNRNEILTAGLDDVEKLKSITGITSIWIEEATEITYADFKQLDLRLRGHTDSYKQIVLTYNPIWDGHWINKYPWPSQKSLEIVTTWRDNKYLDQDYLDMLSDLKDQDPNLYRVYSEGLWGSMNWGNRAYSSFMRDKHTQDLSEAILEDPQLVITFDFNVNPITAVCYEYYKDLRIYYQPIEWRIANSQTLEIAEAVAEYLVNRLSQETLSRSIIISGDSSGNNRSTKSNRSDYQIIYDVLDSYGIDYYPVIPDANPSVRDRINYVNTLIARGHLVINPNCQHSIDDRDLVSWKKGGQGFILDKSDPERTHSSDAGDYGLYNTQFLLIEDLEDEKDGGSRWISGDGPKRY